jgi:nucleoside-diphosphate-sugar epimerase
MRVLMIGGTGVIGRCIVDQLLEKQHEVIIFNRRPSVLEFDGKVREILGDRKDADEFRTKMENLEVDIVIDMISFNRPDAELTINTFKNRVQQIIITSSVAVYKRPLKNVPTFEDQEELTDDPSFDYAYQKAEMERYLHKMIEDHQLPVTILRPSLTFGEGAKNLGVLRQNFGIIDRIKRKKPLVMFGDGTTPFSFTFAPDLAKAYIGVLGNKASYGKCYHIANPEQHIWEDFYLEIGKNLGIDPVIVHIPSEILHLASPELFSHIHFEKKYAGLYDISKISKDVPELSFDIPLKEGVDMMIKDYEDRGESADPEKDAFEDQLVELYQNWRKEFSIIAGEKQSS